jgi:hypothetical protein
MVSLAAMADIVPVRFLHGRGLDMARRRNVVRLGVPGLIVAGLAVVALWRVGAPADDPRTVGTSGRAAAGRSVPLTQIVEVLSTNAVGRQASLERVAIHEVTSPRTFWIGMGDESSFVVLDPDVKRSPDTRVTRGARVTIIGLVRPAPAPAEAVRQWAIDAATADVLKQRGTYVHATEIRPAL